jgi:hypothetical protein
MTTANQFFAEIKTKSNFRNLNGELLKVSAFCGTIIECIIFDEYLQKEITASFNLSEVVRIYQK